MRSENIRLFYYEDSHYSKFYVENLTTDMEVAHAIVMVYMLIFGILGNFLVLFITTVRWKLQTSFNLFISILAIGDIFRTITDLITLLFNDFYKDWIFGSIGCKVNYFLRYFSSGLSVASMISAMIILQCNGDTKISIFVVIINCILSEVYASFLAKTALLVSADDSNENSTAFCSLKFWETNPGQESKLQLELFVNCVLPIIVLIIFGIIWWNKKKSFPNSKLLTILIATLAILTAARFALNQIFFFSDLLLKLYVAKVVLYYILHDGFRKEIKSFFVKSNRTNRTSPSINL